MNNDEMFLQRLALACTYDMPCLLFANKEFTEESVGIAFRSEPPFAAGRAWH